jgi:hypothetical protein
MKTEAKMLLLVCLLSLVYLLGTALSKSGSRVHAQSGPLDVTLESCAAFAGDESHLNAAYQVVTKGYKNIPGQEKPVAQIEGVENPKKTKEFIDWYANGGRAEMETAGTMCMISTSKKSGATAELESGRYIAEERARNAEFFADKLFKQCTGKSLK